MPILRIFFARALRARSSAAAYFLIRFAAGQQKTLALWFTRLRCFEPKMRGLE
jgi:hypothetical protein